MGLAAAVIIASSRRPRYVHHSYRERVIVVSNASSERVVRLECPGGVYEGNIMEISIDGSPYFVTVPPGVGPGMIFDARIPAPPPKPKVVVVQKPDFQPPAAIVSDNHGTWTRLRYESLRGAEKAWGSLGILYASVLFVLTPSGTFNAFKEYGTAKAKDEIKKRFHETFKFELFPEIAQQHVVAQASPSSGGSAPPAYPSAPPAYATPVDNNNKY